MHQYSSKTGKWFLILLNFGWMVDLAMSIFEFITKFLIFWHPWHPWVCVRSDLKQIWAIPPTVQGGQQQQSQVVSILRQFYILFCLLLGCFSHFFVTRSAPNWEFFVWAAVATARWQSAARRGAPLEYTNHNGTEVFMKYLYKNFHFCNDFPFFICELKKSWSKRLIRINIQKVNQTSIQFLPHCA